MSFRGLVKQITVIILCTLAAQYSAALNRSGELLYHFETSVNPLLYPEDQHKYPQVIRVPHVEIPLSFVLANLSDQLDPSVYKSLVFSKNGVPTLRWFLAPDEKDIPVGAETSKFNQEVIDFLKLNHLDPTVYRQFIGYPTAATTYLVENPETKAAFFIKTSNSMAPAGTYKSKKREAWEANDARIFNDYLTGLAAEKPFQYFGFLPETAGFTLSGLNMSLIAREAGEINKATPNKIYLPAFSALDPVLGEKIARANGSTDPQQFWSKALPELLAAAGAELLLRTGLRLDSPHSQNYFFEMDTDFKLTGKIIFRDLADMTILKEFYEFFKTRFHLDRLMQAKRILDPAKYDRHTIPFYLTPFASTRFNKSPLFVNHPWLPKQEQVVEEWAKHFNKKVIAVFKELAGITISEKAAPENVSIGSLSLKKPDGFGFDLVVGPDAKDWNRHMMQVKTRTTQNLKVKCSQIH
jgi:hypothetical protein